MIIQDIFNDIEILTRELSLLINPKLGKRFFDFINIYHIENMMEILKGTIRIKVTIIEILYEVGFNSKSFFNATFKKYACIALIKCLKNNIL